MIKLGDFNFTSIKQGSTDIVAVYLADEMIWGGSQPSVGGDVILHLTGGTLSSITYSDGIIPQRAFRQNSAITRVEIESGITQIGQSAFAYCSGITDVEIGENVTSIGGDAFYYCTALSSVSIPNSVTTIGDEAFMSCNSLSSLTIGNGVTSIGDYALQSYHLSSITCNAVTAPSLGTSVFATLPSSGTLYVPYGSDYSSWIGTSATSGDKLASGWTIQYINAPTSYIQLYDNSYNQDYITFNISWQGGSSSVTYNNGYALVEVPTETNIAIAPSFDDSKYIEDAQCDGTPNLVVSLQIEISEVDELDGKGVIDYMYEEAPENYPNAVYTYDAPTDSIVINFLESGETANVGVSSMSQVDFQCEPFMEEPEPEPEPEEPIE